MSSLKKFIQKWPLGAGVPVPLGVRGCALVRWFGSDLQVVQEKSCTWKVIQDDQVDTVNLMVLPELKPQDDHLPGSHPYSLPWTCDAALRPGPELASLSVLLFL